MKKFFSNKYVQLASVILIATVFLFILIFFTNGQLDKLNLFIPTIITIGLICIGTIIHRLHKKDEKSSVKNYLKALAKITVTYFFSIPYLFVAAIAINYIFTVFKDSSFIFQIFGIILFVISTIVLIVIYRQLSDKCNIGFKNVSIAYIVFLIWDVGEITLGPFTLSNPNLNTYFDPVLAVWYSILISLAFYEETFALIKKLILSIHNIDAKE